MVQRQASIIQTLQETAEVPPRLQLDRVVDVAVGIQRQTTDDPTVAFREMTDERSDNDSGDDELSEESSDTEVINGDADDTKNAVAHDSQMRCSPSFLPVSIQVCVETDVIRPKEKGQPVMEGTQLRSSQQTANSSDTSSLGTGGQESWATSLRDLVHRGGKLSCGQTRRGEKVAVTFVLRTPTMRSTRISVHCLRP